MVAKVIRIQILYEKTKFMTNFNEAPQNVELEEGKIKKMQMFEYLEVRLQEDVSE